jgi:hypothetical protein
MGAGGSGSYFSRIFLLTRLCAGGPVLALSLILFTWVSSPGICRAGDLASTLKTSLTVDSTNAPTNGVTVAETTLAETNTFTLSFTQRPIDFNLKGAPAQSGKTSRAASVGFVLTQRRPAAQGDWFGSFFFNQSGDGNVGFFNMEAGYGQAYDRDSVVLRGGNGTALEEPRYIFFKRIVKF